MSCMKQSYVSKADAKLAAKLLKKLGVNGCGRKGTVIKRGGRLRPYLCKEPDCQEWHLTSKK